MAPSIVVFIQTFTDVLGSALRNKSSSPVICPSVRQPALNTTSRQDDSAVTPFPKQQKIDIASLAQAKI
ncbi:hypothetical protein HBI56_000550 [Parastagonospora nodorum]|nr:hypothetical protein HBH52_149580 [Parastagonospora nodorum]KAH3983441.1 hypothetical protein HBH51_032500 [Parastagonospora nodorum]KAH4032710.1 hypothetical protein HBI13_000970 [Parastagonospora nodorum]KAH4041514.1 hypothetical protein HBI09_000870 [Parastagonospora nodorum]KAH4098972.1 hypothetical protein HBH48_000980 [Parastagonospora nodorum]